MTYGKKNETGEGTFHLNKDEVKKFEAGEPIVKETGDRYGDYRITLKLNVRSLRDKNGNDIKPGNKVLMPEPERSDDYWKQGGFEATVHCFKDGGVSAPTGERLITVEDCEGNGWDVEANRVELMEG